MKKITKLIAVFISSLAVTSCFDMTEHPYTLMDASNYFTDETAVKQAIANIYAQEQGDISEFYWYAAELTADQIAWRSWNGGSWGVRALHPYLDAPLHLCEQDMEQRMDRHRPLQQLHL